MSVFGPMAPVLISSIVCSGGLHEPAPPCPLPPPPCELELPVEPAAPPLFVDDPCVVDPLAGPSFPAPPLSEAPPLVSLLWQPATPTATETAVVDTPSRTRDQVRRE